MLAVDYVLYEIDGKDYSEFIKTYETAGDFNGKKIIHGGLHIHAKDVNEGITEACDLADRLEVSQESGDS